MMLMMGNISLGLTVCILALLCTSVNATPLEKDPEAPQVEPRAFVTVTADVPVVTAVKQVNAPWYNTACKVGGCTFSYEASLGMISLRGGHI